MYKKLIAVFALILALLFFPTAKMTGITEQVDTRIDVAKFIENVPVYKSLNAYANIKMEAQHLYDKYGLDFRILSDDTLSTEEVAHTLLVMNQNNQLWYGIEIMSSMGVALLIKLLVITLFLLMYQFGGSAREEDMRLA